MNELNFEKYLDRVPDVREDEPDGMRWSSGDRVPRANTDGIPPSLMYEVRNRRGGLYEMPPLDPEDGYRREKGIAQLVAEHWQRMESDADYRAQVEQEFAEEKARKEAEERGQRIHRLEDCGVPRLHAPLIVDDSLQDTEALKAAREAEEGSILVLAGSVGTGKSLAAGALVYRFMDEHASFMTAAALARTSAYDNASMYQLNSYSALVIDDVGTEYSDAKGFFSSMFDALINQRYADANTTCITTNLNGKAFSARYGSRIIDRIRERGRFVECAGESLRRKG